MCTLSVLRRFGVEAPLLRSGVVAVDSTAAAATAVLFVHGAPSVIQQLANQASNHSSNDQAVNQSIRQFMKPSMGHLDRHSQAELCSHVQECHENHDDHRGLPSRQKPHQQLQSLVDST